MKAFSLVFLLPSVLLAQIIQSSFIMEFGNRDPFFTKISNASSLSVGPLFDCYIADAGNNRIMKFDPQGNFVGQIGGFGWQHGQFQNPTSIFLYNSLDLFIADYENDRIERYDKDLNYISSYANNDAWEEKWQFRFPKAVAASLHGDVFIIDSDNKRVLKYSPSFEPQLEFGNYDWGDGALQEPVDICISTDDKIYIADAQAGQIMLYDYFGNFLYTISHKKMQRPSSVFVNEGNLIFVTDASQDKFLVFNARGEIIYEFGTTGSEICSFRQPVDISMQKDRLYILDAKNNRVQVFKITIQPE